MANFGENNSAWTGRAVRVHGEYLFQGSQLSGMSGASALNGCGFQGIAHVKDTTDPGVAQVIPASMIFTCLDRNLHLLQKASNCAGSPVVLPKLLAVKGC